MPAEAPAAEVAEVCGVKYVSGRVLQIRFDCALGCA